MYFFVRFGRKSQWYPLAIFRENVNSENLGNDWCVSVKAPAQGGVPVAIKDRSRSSGARRTNPVKSVKPSQIQSKTVKILLKMVIVTRVFRSLPTRHRSLLATARSRAPDTSCSTSALRVPALTAVKTLKYQSKTVKILLNTSQNPIVQNCSVLIY